MGLIRNFKEGDEKACAELARINIEADANLSEEGREWLIGHESESKFRERSLNYDFILIYAERGEVKGVVCFNKGQLVSLYVRPDVQFRGVGKKLVLELERRAGELGHERIWMDANPEAVPFYEKFGYVKTEDKIIGQDIKIVVMEKKLTYRLNKNQHKGY